MISPRTTRLVRVSDLHGFRQAVVELCRAGSPLDARDRLVVVPTRAAAAHLVRSLEHRLPAGSGASVLPELVTSDELHLRCAERLPDPAPRLTGAEREVLLGVASRQAIAEGYEPPFQPRPGLVAEMLRFYDRLRRNQKDVDAFERLAAGLFEPAAPDDRGAERLLRQTRFLAAAFRHFERRCREAGAADEHVLRHAAILVPARRPWRHVVVTVGDAAFDPDGLCAADWDLLARVPGLERLDIVATDATVAGAYHERIHQILPGIEEVRGEAPREPSRPMLVAAPGGAVAHADRDREEEVAAFARWIRQARRTGDLPSLDRAALVVHRPLPYVYVAREVLRSAGVACQTFDALPLAGEPYAAALDLVFACVAGNFARVPATALLRSPHFRFGLTLVEVAALDRALSEAGYLGDLEAFDRLVDAWREAASHSGRPPRALRAGEALGVLAHELAPLRAPGPGAHHLDRVIAFVTSREPPPGPDDPLRARERRARAAILGTLGSLRDAYARFDDRPVEFDAIVAMVRRWIEGHTFAPRIGEGGVHLVDAASARFGDFDAVQLAGLVDGEWPDRPRRSIFYSPAMLRDLGWPSESERLDAARAAFQDLIRLPASRLRVSTFTLEDDALVAPSSLLDGLEGAGLEVVESAVPSVRIFEYEALGLDPVDTTPLTPIARRAAERRLEARSGSPDRCRGMTRGQPWPAYSLSALERYQDCPFKAFAADVLDLEEAPDEDGALSPRARGRFIHEVFQRFFAEWDRQGPGTITSERVDRARALFEEVAAPLLARLPDADASLERARLFGSAVAIGMVDLVLGLEASRPRQVLARWLEYRLEGEFSLGAPDGTRVPLKGVADRVDLLEGRRLRVIDYKSGYPPNPRRALQVPIYALCAQERAGANDGSQWSVDEAAYVAFSDRRTLVPVIKPGAGDPDAVLAAARDRLFGLVQGIERGEYPPKPHEPRLCTYCAYPSVCRKDYVGDEERG